jgi:aquaporin Z
MVSMLFLHAVINVSATYGSNYPAVSYSAGSAFWMEFILTVGLARCSRRPKSHHQNLSGHANKGDS